MKKQRVFGENIVKSWVAVLLVAGGAFAEGPDLSDRVAETTFVAFSVETTGSNPKEDRVMAIHAVKFYGGGTVLASTNWLVNPHRAIPEGSAAREGLSAEQVAEAPSFDEVWDAFELFCDGAILLEDQAKSKVKFLRMELEWARRVSPALPLVDTKPLFRMWFPNAHDGSLESLVAYLGVDEKTYARAEVEAFRIVDIFRVELSRRPEMTLWRMDLEVDGFKWLGGSRCP